MTCFSSSHGLAVAPHRPAKLPPCPWNDAQVPRSLAPHGRWVRHPRLQGGWSAAAQGFPGPLEVQGLPRGCGGPQLSLLWPSAPLPSFPGALRAARPPCCCPSQAEPCLCPSTKLANVSPLLLQPDPGPWLQNRLSTGRTWLCAHHGEIQAPLVLSTSKSPRSRGWGSEGR